MSRIAAVALALATAPVPAAAQSGWDWSLQTGLPGENPIGIWAADPGNVFASGGYRTLDGFNGTDWFSYVHPAGANRYRLFGVSGTDVWSAGQWNLLHYDGTSWTEVLATLGHELVNVWASSAADIYASGDGLLMHYDGTGWTSIPTGLPTCPNCDRLEGLWGAGPGLAWAASTGGTLLEIRDNVATPVPIDVASGVGLISVSGTGPRDVWVGASDGSVYHFNGRTWTRTQTGIATAIFGIHAFGRRDVYATSYGGVLLHFDGRSWSPVATGTTRDLYGIHGVKLGGRQYLFAGAQSLPEEHGDRGAVLAGVREVGHVVTPEPVPAGLIAVGLLVLLVARRRRRPLSHP